MILYKNNIINGGDMIYIIVTGLILIIALLSVAGNKAKETNKIINKGDNNE